MKPKTLYYGAKRSKTTGGWKSVVFSSDGKLYLNLAVKGGSKQYHQDLAGLHVSRMRSTSKFKGFKAQKITSTTRIQVKS
jgi:hypothetical protein